MYAQPTFTPLEEVELMEIQGGCESPVMHFLLIFCQKTTEWLKTQGDAFVDGFNHGTGACPENN